MSRAAIATTCGAPTTWPGPGSGNDDQIAVVDTGGLLGQHELVARQLIADTQAGHIGARRQTAAGIVLARGLAAGRSFTIVPKY